jgi:formamidopyrimidine-DNA glycosylase
MTSPCIPKTLRSSVRASKLSVMPELPEVQTTVNGINRYLRGLKIVDVWTNYKSAYHNGKNHIKNYKFFPIFKNKVVDSKIIQAERRAKNILIHLSNENTILVHMKMTGHLLYGKYGLQKRGKDETWVAIQKGPLRDDPFNRFIRLVFTLSNGKHFVLSDLRKFAKVTVLPTKDIPDSSELSHLGPEPLDDDFTVLILENRLNRRPNCVIKQALMDQTLIAGIGNIYSDEILWASSIHPKVPVRSLKRKDFVAIWKNMQVILNKGLDFKGDSMSDYRTIDGTPGKFQNEHRAYRRTGKPCTKRGCKGTIRRMVIGARSAHFCDTHQKLKI